MRTAIVLSLLLAISGCSDPPQEPLDLRATPALPSYESTLSEPDQLLLTEGSPITVTAGESGLVLSGNVANASSQFQTEGAALALGQTNEQAFANRTVRVTIRARGIGATGFRVAYSTNDNGNSGWRDLPLSEDFADLTFDYQVPAINRGADDFLGILPPETGSVEVQAIRVEITQ
jgi:hypothetical protein